MTGCLQEMPMGERDFPNRAPPPRRPGGGFASATEPSHPGRRRENLKIQRLALANRRMGAV
jgi:hypothetical protein